MKRERKLTILKDTVTGEIFAICDLTEARARALVKAYRNAGLFLEAI